jgi:hypothetical protein
MGEAVPIAARKVASKRLAALAMAVAAPLAASIIAAPSAGAAVWGGQAQVSPNTQSRDSGEKAVWYVSANAKKIATIVVHFSDGKSARYSLSSSGGLQADFTVRHAFYPGCTTHAPHTYTQRWGAQDYYGDWHWKNTTVTVTYRGPLCV